MNKEGSQYKIYKYTQKLKYTNDLNKKRVYQDKLRYYNKFNQHGGDENKSDVSKELEKCRNQLAEMEKLEFSLYKKLSEATKLMQKYHYKIKYAKKQRGGDDESKRKELEKCKNKVSEKKKLIDRLKETLEGMNKKNEDYIKRISLLPQ